MNLEYMLTERHWWLLFVVDNCPDCDKVKESFDLAMLPGLYIYYMTSPDDDTLATADWFDVVDYPSLRQEGNTEQWNGAEAVIAKLKELTS